MPSRSYSWKRHAIRCWSLTKEVAHTFQISLSPDPINRYNTTISLITSTITLIIGCPAEYWMKVGNDSRWFAFLTNSAFCSVQITTGLDIDTENEIILEWMRRKSFHQESSSVCSAEQESNRSTRRFHITPLDYDYGRSQISGNGDWQSCTEPDFPMISVSGSVRLRSSAIYLWWAFRLHLILE
jgi:hypothetical protein